MGHRHADSSYGKENTQTHEFWVTSVVCYSDVELMGAVSWNCDSE